MENKEQEQQEQEQQEDSPVVIKQKKPRASRKMTEEEKLQRKIERDRQKLIDQELLMQLKSGIPKEKINIPQPSVQKPYVQHQPEIVYGEDYSQDINALKQQIASMQNDMMRQQALLFEKQRKIKERVVKQEQSVIQIKTLQEQRDERKKLKEEQKKQAPKQEQKLEQKLDVLAQTQQQQLSFMQQYMMQQKQKDEQKQTKQDLFSLLNKSK